MTRHSMAVLTLCLAAIACGRPTAPPAPLPANISLTPVASGFSDPVFLTSPPGDDRLFVVEKAGRIRVIENGATLATPYLDIVAKVSSPGERGLLGLAFHPDFASNGFFYVNFTDLNGNTRVERYHATPTANVADPPPNSATLIIGYDQPFSNHNGGMLLFGPDDMLWIGTGDGGSGGDPRNPQPAP